MFFLNISIIIADINTVQTTLCSEISLRSIFQDILPKKDVAVCETTDTAHSYIKQIVNFSEVNVSIDA